MKRKVAARPYHRMLPRITAAKTTPEVLGVMEEPRNPALKYHNHPLGAGIRRTQQRLARRLTQLRKARLSHSALPSQGRVGRKTSSRS